MHRLIGEQAGHRAVAEAMTHMTTEAPELERLDAERRAEVRRGPIADAVDASLVTVVTDTSEQGPSLSRRSIPARARLPHDDEGR